MCAVARRAVTTDDSQYMPPCWWRRLQLSRRLQVPASAVYVRSVQALSGTDDQIVVEFSLVLPSRYSSSYVLETLQSSLSKMAVSARACAVHGAMGRAAMAPPD